MKSLRFLRYALLLFAAAAYANGPGSVAAAPSSLPSCDECDENTPCDTECNGTYAEEPTETTCGVHRNFGGTCAGECGDNFCDSWENPSNCCTDCNPGNCGPPQCVPQYSYSFVSGPWAEGPRVWYAGYDFEEEVHRWDCDWLGWDRWLATEQEPNCPQSPDTVDICDEYLIAWTAFAPITTQWFSTWDAEDECEDYFWYYTRFGTPNYCGF